MDFKKSLSIHSAAIGAVLLVFACPLWANSADPIRLDKHHIRIVFSDKEPGPVKIAFAALKKDFMRAMDAEPVVTETMDADRSSPEIVIVNRATGAIQVPSDKVKPLDGFESHRVYADPESNRIYVEGHDLRGTIYAMYTFSEQVLGVPPLHVWCSWVPVKKETVAIPGDFNLYYRSPQVRYRSLLPGDQDFFNPWKKRSAENQNVWLETALRLKLNTVETYSTIEPGYRLTDYANLIDRYGLVITAHHTCALNTSFSTWEAYWQETRHQDPPKLLLANEPAILEFFRYNAETVKRSGIENLWTIAFRGRKDQPFWSVFEDAPDEERDRAEVINRMLRIQLDLITEVTEDPDPYVRITFYDEIADLMAKGHLKPPASENMIWTFVAARRDPYPYDDLIHFTADKPVKLGYYMNFAFASTGAHVAPAEGPWKMEFNYRYVSSKSPLYFSVVNVGNMREFLLELSANAKMLWDYDAYNTDQFMLDYCTQYFGAEHAGAIARLYRDFYHAYWQPKATEFPGMARQFLFQDLRYARAFDHMVEEFYASEGDINMNPLHKIGYESVPGRTFRIDLEHNHSTNQVDAMLYGMTQTIPKFESVAARCSDMMGQLDEDKQTFFNDNLRVHSHYMAHLSKTLYHYVYAYKHQKDPAALGKHLDLAYHEAVRAQQVLFEAQHGIFSTWYSDAEPLNRTFQIDRLLTRIIQLKEQDK
ncbi:MAG: glycosyl hydrolase 115 family protein [Phycisphaerae bacterium]|nr:glycosyl hydrolase 115 family protein [Phycisphaerae bacterium]